MGGRPGVRVGRPSAEPQVPSALQYSAQKECHPMKPLLIAVVTAATVCLAVPARAQSADPRIVESLQPLPDDLKAGATVVTYDAATGARQVLRQGTNQIECQPKA